MRGGFDHLQQAWKMTRNDASMKDKKSKFIPHLKSHLIGTFGASEMPVFNSNMEQAKQEPRNVKKISSTMAFLAAIDSAPLPDGFSQGLQTTEMTWIHRISSSRTTSWGNCRFEYFGFDRLFWPTLYSTICLLCCVADSHIAAVTILRTKVHHATPPNSKHGSPCQVSPATLTCGGFSAFAVAIWPTKWDG